MNSKVDRDVSFRRVKGNFSHFSKVNHANFEDENLNVPYPIMTIHGNHDDPTGPQARSVCEKFATCGLLNYFGAIKGDCKQIHIEPIILQKDRIKIALYGLGFIPDFKLKLAFDKGEVTFEDPPADTFNVLAVHQNRWPIMKLKYIPDEIFPKFFHLIIRGHEHATMAPEPLLDSEVNGMVYQPGSTVATSICTKEAAPKKVGIVSVSRLGPKLDSGSQYNADYEMFDLKCARKMIFEDIPQKSIFKFIKKSSGSVQVTAADFKRLSSEFVEQKIRDLVSRYAQQQQQQQQPITQSGDEKSQAKINAHFRLPLLRVRLEYVSKSERFDELAVSSKFYPDQVANKDIILFKKQKIQKNDQGLSENITFAPQFDSQEDDEDDLFDHINLNEEKRDTIDSMIEGYFKSKPKAERLVALSLEEYTNAVRGSSEDGNVISKVLQRKKWDILNDFKKVVQDEKVANEKFNNEDQVRDWFCKAFEGSLPAEAMDEDKWDDDDDDVVMIE